MPWAKLYVGDARELPLSDESVHTVITSPPYWGLRDYQVEPVVWDNPGGCDHDWGEVIQATNAGGGWFNPGSRSDYPTMRLKDPAKEIIRRVSQGSFCSRCNAWRGSLGLEPTPDLYVRHIVQAMQEVRSILRKDGTIWLNLGDSYIGSGSPGGDFRDGKGGDAYLRPYNRRADGLKPKDLAGIPWRVAFALQADGWWLRSDIIWAKPNPMPESVRDRPTRSHEYLFLLTKSRRYYYDCDAIREPHAPSSIERVTSSPMTGSGMSISVDGARVAKLDHVELNPLGRNRRTVWWVTTEPFKGAHFATFPEKLVDPCILAGTSGKGACARCGAPWRRVIQNSGTGPQRNHRKNRQIRLTRLAGQAWEKWKARNPNLDLGWRSSCMCDAGDTVPSVVLDPFMGSGTVGVVAARLGRNFIGVDLKPEYVGMAARRIRQEGVEVEVLESGQKNDTVPQ